MKYSKEQIEVAINATKSMAEAAKYAGIHYKTFIRQAKKYNIYKPNPGGAGISKRKINKGINFFTLEDILNGKHPGYDSGKLKIRLLDVGLKQNICEICNITNIWNNLLLVMHLDHIDGDSGNNNLDNLRILCPNCHTQTSTYGNKKRIKVSVGD